MNTSIAGPTDIKQLTSQRAIISSLVCTGLGIVLILISLTLTKPSGSQSPNDTSILASLMQAIGSTLFTIGLTSFIYDLYVRRDFAREVGITIGDLVDDRITQEIELLARLEHTGLYRITDNVDHTWLNYAFENAKREILILQTWMPDLTQLESSIIAGAKSGAKIRILLVNPKHAYLDQRTKDLKVAENLGSSMVDLNQGELRRIVKQNNLNDKIELRFYNCIPPFAMYGADDDIVIGLFWYKLQAVNGRCHHYKLITNPKPNERGSANPLRNAKAMGEYYVKNFTEIWNDSDVVDWAMGKPDNSDPSPPL